MEEEEKTIKNKMYYKEKAKEKQKIERESEGKREKIFISLRLFNESAQHLKKF